MKKTNKILSIILAILMVISIIPITANAATYSGTCGANLTWTYDSSTFTLTISGTGDMYDYGYDNRPWEAYVNKIKEVVIADGITSIGAYAFAYCYSLTNVIIPDTVTKIGTSAIYACESLTNIIIPYGVLTIDYRAFANCRSLTNVIIPDSVETIGERAFSQCDNLESITIGKSVTSIGNNAFYSCSTLTEIIIPNSVTSIGEKTFYSCDNLQAIIVDSDNQYYSSDEYGVLFNKDKTTLIKYPIGNIRVEYIIPDGVTIIGDYAFSSCSLTNITIPNSVTTIGYQAFGGCYITNMIIPESVITINDSAFYGCSYLANITIGNGVTTIGPRVFFSCDSLTNVTIGNSVTTIGEYAFNKCSSLTSITISDSVTEIGNSAFSYCSSLSDVYYTGTEEQWDSILIGTNNSLLLNATIHYNYMPTFTGIKGDYFYKDDVKQKAYQLVEFDGDFYFINDYSKIAKDKRIYLSERFVNGFTYEDGTPLKVGYYEFDENGKMIIHNGVVGDYFYKNNERLKAYQLVEFDGDFYFINDSHKLAKNKTLYLSDRFVNGFTYEDGTPLKAGYYTFDENGKMVMLNGPVGDYFYENNVRLNAYQLVEFEGNYYFINDSHKLAKNKRIYLSQRFVEGTDLKVGYYNFDADGKMIIE